MIANSSAFMGPPSAWDARIDAVRRHGMSVMIAPVLERWFTPAFAADATRTAAIRQMLENTSVEGYAGCCVAIRDMDLRPLLSLIRTPCLVIGGDQDPATPPTHTSELHAGIVGSQCVMLNAAHLSNIEQPDLFTRAIIDFVLA